MLKMNVNEACALAKRMESWKRELSLLLLKNEYIYNIKEEHQKNLADETKTPEVIENQVEKQYNVSIDEICKIIEVLIEEKTKLSELIENTKNNLKVEIDGKLMTIDAATEYNKGLRDFAYSLNNLSRMKDKTVKSQERDFRLDVEGKQTTYIYPCVTTYELTFTKKEIESKKRELTKKADKNSIEIDKARITSEMEFDTNLEVTDSLEEVIEKILDKRD